MSYIQLAASHLAFGGLPQEVIKKLSEIRKRTKEIPYKKRDKGNPLQKKKKGKKMGEGFFVFWGGRGCLTPQENSLKPPQDQ